MTRIYHTFYKWECYPAGFYESHPPEGKTKEDCERIYYELLCDSAQFEAALKRVIAEWKFSCEHYLSNENMNRIAWLGQASLCITHHIPSCFRGGFNLLTPAEQEAANLLALKYLNIWLARQGDNELDLLGAASKTEANLY
jgi:hypothetical protein